MDGVSLWDLGAPSKDSLSVSYVTVIQPPEGSPGLSRAQEVSRLDVQNGVFNFMMWLWVT